MDLYPRILIEMDPTGEIPDDSTWSLEKQSEDHSAPWNPPPPSDDRVWRHPSELASQWHTNPDTETFTAVYKPQPAPQSKPALRSMALVALASGVTGAILVVALLGALGELGTSKQGRDVVVREQVGSATRSMPATDRAPAGDVVAIAAQVSPAIVRMKITAPSQSSGSGVLFRDNGYLLTNAHVVKGAKTLFAVLADGTEIAGEIVGQDPETDIAVVKLERDEPFATATLGTAIGLKVGQPAVAIGSPLGLIGGSSVSTGVVSALGRRVDSEDGNPLLDMIQTDAAIAPGSSGGALLDHNGSVIGITTAIAVSQVGAEGLGFATPIDIARSVADQIIATGKAEHVWLGIEGADLDPVSAKKASIPGGARIERVVRDSPAHAAGLAKQDIIIAVGDESITSMAALVLSLRDRRPGQEIAITYIRDNKRNSLTLTLSKRPKNL